MKTNEQRYVTPKDQEEINETIYNLRSSNPYISWANIARRAGWSVTTVKKYYDPNWHSGKYFQKPMPASKVYNNRNPGLYLLAQQVLDDGKIINLIKIGQSRDLSQRLNSYKGMNPFAKCIDVINCPADKLNELEKSFHLLLGTKNQRYGSTEWFICDDDEFKHWSTYKFSKVLI